MLRSFQRSCFPGKRNFATSISRDLAYDVVIIGGGVAGVTLACALASSPAVSRQRIALVEAMDLTGVKSWEPKQDNYSNRVVSLTPGTMNFFSKIGVKSHMLLDRTHGYRDMRVWDGVTGAKIHLDSALLNTNGQQQTIAYMVENVNVQSAALKRIEECRAQGVHIDIFQKTKVAEINRESEVSQDGIDLKDWPTIHLDDGKKLKARLLIGADGINSPVRDFAGIESLGWDYDAQGVVATLKLDPERPESSLTAWQRFLPTGPIAMLPLAEGYASMVWSTYPGIAQALKTIPASDFCTMVNAAFRMSHVDLSYLYKQITQGKSHDIQGEYEWRESIAKKPLSDNEILKREHSLPPQVIDVQQHSRASFPFRLRNAERYVADRVALVGDAAHATHPLAGQGLNQGILDVECLSTLVEKGTMEGQDIGNIHLLRQYASERYLRNIMMISSCDKLHRLYSTDVAPVTWIRSLGLNAVNQMDFLKAEIMKYAMGIEYNGDIRRM
ncbi:hypothetical protein G6F70_004137 [Rhizopus microsporus]|uniref:Ubiquinone biosynthesis monooxygenase COQ6, mitochondrial n=2 Tax=Rhizopus TaxID=4842 RepID=A0A367KDI5_RHIAZ|nr:hypothetical protein G6F71_003085 [Rhizopus microsporus]RCI00249.1 putative ubiquinone biosynthesis monooxygenase [Rhizopus azygosporus]KAG1200354.1 hypothetical protein G6F70_004137 [Rhizopus microsporus]KAG1211977.1 hypothetical protein G6F69_004121 [Rhizopus microsporus]KAG1236442.1 hypothetical protein G6F67_001988 [Rhizopus microsporus]